MGGSTSAPSAPPPPQHSSMEEIIAFVRPIFYTDDAITKEELDAATLVWKMILNNKSQHFLSLRAADPNFVPLNCMEYFYDIFYNRLFDVHPSCRTLFKKSISKQGSFFLRMISLLLTEIDDKEKFFRTLENLANIHNKMGVKAVECKSIVNLISYEVSEFLRQFIDGIAGEVLLYTIRKCVGDTAFTPAAHRGWCKIYSRILDATLPPVVKFEMNHKEQANTIAIKRNNQTTHTGTLFVDATKHSNAQQVAEEIRTAHSTGQTSHSAV